MSHASEDWYGVLKGLVEGDAESFFRVSQLVTGVLRGTRAYDIESDWSDVLQDVAMATVDAMREGRLEASDNVVGFVRQIARHKIYDRLRRRTRTGAGKTTSLDDAPPDALADRRPTDSGDLLDLRRSLERLPEAERNLVVAVYGERRTYEEASKELGIPLGTAKRLLRQGMARLRKRFPKGERT